MSEVKRAAKKKTICRAFLQLLGEGHSVHEVTVQQIASAAGIGKGTIYDYFESRDDIFANAVLMRFIEQNEAMETLLQNETLTFLQTLETWLDLVAKAVTGKDAIPQLLMQGNDCRAVWQALAPHEAQCKAMMLRRYELMAVYLQRGVAEGVCSADAVQEFGIMALEACFGTYISALLAPSFLPVNEVRQTACKMLLKTLS